LALDLEGDVILFMKTL